MVSTIIKADQIPVLARVDLLNDRYGPSAAVLGLAVIR
jgi:hypothetical protein